MIALTICYLAGITTGLGVAVLIVSYLRRNTVTLTPEGDDTYNMRHGEPRTKGAPSR